LGVRGPGLRVTNSTITNLGRVGGEEMGSPVAGARGE
jgi:hypothetical protein